MPNHLLVVEGAHDAAFFGKLLQRRSFTPVKKLAHVPADWRKLIPTRYPFTDSGQLDRVVICPEIWIRPETGDVYGVIVAGGDSSLLARARDGLDLILGDISSVGIVLDADHEMTPAQRFADFVGHLQSWNERGVGDFNRIFPLPIPLEAGAVLGEPVRFGIHLLPGAADSGALEKLLIACADVDHSVLRGEAERFLEAAHAAYDIGSPEVAKSRTASGRAKATCGVIANVFKPGSSLAVSLRDSTWLPADEKVVPYVSEAAQFLDRLLDTENGAAL